MIVERIEAANLPAATYRTARRLLDICNPRTGAASVTHERLRSLAGTDADGTARRHLIELQAAGILTYRRNSEVQIWFADWQPDNVISGDQQRSAVISGDHQARENEHRSVISGDHQVINSRAGRSNRASSDHLPHTHASARSGWLVGINQSTKIDNQPTNPPEAKTELQPWEPELSYRLLTDKRVAMRPDFARQFAQLYPFHHIRDAVAHWRDGAGENFRKQPGIVVAWLKDPGSIVIPAASAEFLRSELGQAYRTPQELAADLEPPPEPPPIARPVQAQPSGYLDDDPGWEVMVSDPHLKGQLAGLVRIDSIDGVPCYVYEAKDALQVQWLNNRCATSLRKTVSMWVGHPVLVEFIAREDDENQDPR
jgi:hypothetical protein